MLLIDTRATETAKSSLFLTREEFKEIYPHRLNSRINYIFFHSKPEEVANEEAKLLLKKYRHLAKWEPELNIVETDRHRELNEINYRKLKTMGAKLGIVFKELAVKKPILVDRIVKKEIENAS